jgi:hypothetical protein
MTRQRLRLARPQLPIPAPASAARTARQSLAYLTSADDTPPLSRIQYRAGNIPAQPDSSGQRLGRPDDHVLPFGVMKQRTPVGLYRCDALLLDARFGELQTAP